MSQTKFIASLCMVGVHTLNQDNINTRMYKFGYGYIIFLKNVAEQGTRIIFAIAGSLGIPISIDEATPNITFGHFARVLLIHINLLGVLQDHLFIERLRFRVYVEYGKLPSFCSCHNIGHMTSECRRKQPDNSRR